MTVAGRTGCVSVEMLAAAREGDEAAFVRLTAGHRRAVHLHAYRLLGSLDDADDAVQETLLRAWRGLAGYDERGAMSAWLHRIATNVALRMIEQRRDPGGRADAHLQPYPDRLAAEAPDPAPGPEVQAVLRETAGLAYIAALQLLPPNQRAVLLLRDGLGWSANDTAGLLDLSIAAANSLLQRARVRLTRERDAGMLARPHAPASPVDRSRRHRGVPGGLGGDRRRPHRRAAHRRRHAHDATARHAIRRPRRDRRVLRHPAGGRTPRPHRIAGITGFPRDPGLFDRFGLDATHS